MGRSERIGLATKSGNLELSLTESDIEEINELYVAVEMAVDLLELIIPWLKRFARKIANGEARVPGGLLLFFRIAANPLPRLLSSDSVEEVASSLDRSEKEFTAQKPAL